LQVKTNGDFTAVNLTVQPVATGSIAAADTTLYLVIFDELAAAGRELCGSEAAAAADTGTRAIDSDHLITALKKELRDKEEYLQTALEEMDTSNEELKATNEEMQSVNEELQSTNEELETSKEELQSVNEELATVNAELQQKVSDLSRSNNDMNNLLAGTGIGTVFVDHKMLVQRFTPAAVQLINLIPTDVGRPVSHIVSNLIGYDRLIEDVQAVLDSLSPREAEVQTREGLWFLLRIRPYRTNDNMIEGAVITFTDITDIKNAQEKLRKAEALIRLAAAANDSCDAMIVQALDGGILAWNSAATSMYGWSEAEALAMNISDLIPEANRQEAAAIVLRLARAEILEPYHAQRITKDGRTMDISLTATALVHEAGDIYAIATTERLAA
jgi:two-component system, chemotaxis family, CheB/CheR fusion protein